MRGAKEFQDTEHRPKETALRRPEDAGLGFSPRLRQTGRVLVLISVFCLLFFAMPASIVRAQDEVDPNAAEAQPTPQPAGDTFSRVDTSVQQQLKESVAELRQLRDRIAKSKIPLTKRLNELENELLEVRSEYQQTVRELDTRTLNLSNLRKQIESRREEKSYLSNLLNQYVRSFEERLHITEIQRYNESLEAAKLAPENNKLSDTEVYRTQVALVAASLERLHDALGGTRFEGSAVDASGLVKRGTFALLGPAALFRSEDGQSVGTAEQRIGSPEPTVIGFESEEMTKAAADTVVSGSGRFPLDPTLGDAHKIEATKTTLLEHIKKGGPVMYPILGLAGLALLVALGKWVQLSLVRNPSQKRIGRLLRAVAEHDDEKAATEAAAIGGPTGKMLSAGVEHIKEPPALIEEVMYEKILAVRLKLQRFLPFIAISAAAAPLLGLLGTVTGIINTFKLITVFGSGDVKMLSGGISEALITTKFGLIVAIPSLLLHAFLSRKARSMVARMEKAAIALINQVSKTPYEREDRADLLAEIPAAVAQEVLRTLHQQGRGEIQALAPYSENSAGGIMDPRVISVGNAGTVADAISRIRTADINEETPTVFVVDERGRYVGELPIHQLLIRSQETPIESLAKANTRYVRVDADKQEVQDLFDKFNLATLPVLNRRDQLVGRITADHLNGNHVSRRSTET